jgi:large subunit ribosomal protein L6
VKYGKIPNSKIMSRIGKKPIEIPAEVQVKIEGNKVTVKGPKGELSKEFRPEIGFEIKEGKIFVFPKIETKITKALWGTYRQLISSMIEGVLKGYEKKLEIEGLGYRATMEGENLVLRVGYSHPVVVSPPKGIKISVEKNIITVFGIDKELVGQVAANIKKVKPAEPYKGKGIKYLGEKIRRKVGKKATTAAK